MLGWFPDPHPDELFYSICARFGEAMHYSSKTSIIIELFGSIHPATIEFPFGLDYLIASLPPEHCYSADSLIDEHTLLPFFGPFLAPERLVMLRETMHGNCGIAIGRRSGNAACLVRPSTHLRLCPQCVLEDRKHFDEAYWHRVHQIPGVLVCPIHAEALEETPIAAPFWNRERYRFYSAEEALQLQSLAGRRVQSPWQPVLLAIAQDAAWLLRQRGLAPGYQVLHQYYQRLFVACGLASLTGQRRLEDLLTLFRERYPDALLHHLGCPLDSNHPGRLKTLFHGLQTWQHPLHHLILMHLLGSTAEDFFQVAAPCPPFGEGPWPCLNAASDHYRRRVVEECQITRSRKYKDHVVGTFACSCGFIYWRQGPDREPENQFRREGIKAVGPVWEARLCQFWEEGTCTQEEMAQQLGMSVSSLREHAMRLGLVPYPAAMQGIGSSMEILPDQSEEQEASLREQHRATWIAALESGASIWTSRHRELQAAYQWLHKHDREWLQEHMPPRKLIERWDQQKSRDAQRAEQVRAIALQLKNNAQRPVQITRAVISREIRQTGWPSGLRDKERYPLTAQALDEVVEASEAFRVRRVWWAANCYQRERICPRRWQLIERAGLNAITVASPVVEAAIDAALRMLATCFSAVSERAVSGLTEDEAS